MPMPTSASRPFSSHAVGALELIVAELHADLLVRVHRMRLGERHRHVEVRDPRLEAGVEDRDVEERIDRVQDGVGSRLADERDDRLLARGVDRVSREAAVVELARRPPAGRARRSRQVRSARRTSGASRSARRQSPHPPFRRRESARRRGSTRTASVVASPPAALRSSRFQRMEVGRERCGYPAEAVHRRGVRRLVVGRDDGGAEPGDRRGDRGGPARLRRGRRPRGRRGEEGVGGVAVEDAQGPHGAPPEARGRHRRERRGARAARVAQRRQAVVGRRRRARRHVRQPPLLRRSGAQPRGQGRDGVRRGLHVDDPARAARDRRRHLPVELPALHGDVEDRPGARGRERPDHQAGRADAAHDAPLRRARAGGHPGGRAPGRDRRRDPRRRRARPPSG